MLLERAEIQVKQGLETAFDAAMRERGLALLRSAAGVKSVSFGRGVENPHKFMLLVEWESMDAHAAFRKASVYPAFSELFPPYSIGGAMEHFQMG